MIVDSSAIVAIVLDEPPADAMILALQEGGPWRMSVANILETWMVVDRRNIPEASKLMEEVFARFGIIPEPLTHEHVTIARDAFRVYGKGSGHKAQLNFGDCIAYGLAKSMNEPLLFIGNDFIHTDLVPALASASE